MMRCLTVLTLSVCCLMTATLRAEDLPVRGSLVIMGGAVRFEDRGIWNRIVELAGGPNASIAIIPVASGQPLESARRIETMLTRLGAQPFVVPLGVRNIDTDYRSVTHDPEWVNKVRSASGVFFTGGSQARITQTLLQEDGEQTPLLSAIWDVYRGGGVIAGTSAGAAIMSRVMFAQPPSSVLRTLQNGIRHGKEVAPGLGFLGENWFVDQHCLVRGRFARAVMAMSQQGIRYGIGVDEDTAVVVREGVELEVVGYKGAILLDCSEAAQDKTLQRFNIKNVKLSYLDHGDRMNLTTLEITPFDPKQEGGKIDPSSPEFRPNSQRKLFAADMLGNTTVIDMMFELLQNAHSEAIGLAFDGAEVMGSERDADGFEFRLYREKDTHGWYTDVRGCDGYTVANMRLDVRPISITRQLYKYIDPEPEAVTAAQATPAKVNDDDDEDTQTASAAPSPMPPKEAPQPSR